jgi:hypothetical protein
MAQACVRAFFDGKSEKWRKFEKRSVSGHRFSDADKA